MSKIYKTWEAFKLLSENPKLVFEYKDTCLDITRRLWRDDEYFMYGVIEKDSKNMLEYNLPGGYQFGGNISITDNWTLARTPVPAWEAIKALSEGKTVICEYTEPFNSTVRKFKIARGDLEGFAFHAELLFKGTWYIDD